MINEYLNTNIKPLLLTIINLLQGLSPSAGTIMEEGTATDVPEDTPTTVVSYTNNESSKVFISGIIGTGNFTGIWTIELPDQLSTKTVSIRTAYGEPNLKQVFVPAVPLEVGKTVTVKVKHSDPGSNEFKGFILGYKSQ